MDLSWLSDLPERTARPVPAIALALVVVITVTDVISPKEVCLSPMLVVAPALAASFAGPWLTAGFAPVALVAQVFVASLNGSVVSETRVWQLAALFVVSVSPTPAGASPTPPPCSPSPACQGKPGPQQYR